MNFRRIEVFLAVEKHLSFSLAADELCIAQSAVSIAIRKLEDELGARLFHRASRSIELTASGRAFLSRAQPALAQLDLARQEVRAQGELSAGSVVLAAPAMVAQFALARPIVEFQVSHPGIRLKMLQGGARDIERWVLSGEVELGIVAHRNAHLELETKLLARFPNVACVAASSPLAQLRRLGWKDLLAQPLVAFPPGYHQRDLMDSQARKRGVALHIALEVESVAVLLEAVRCGIGITTLPAPAVQGLPGLATVALTEDDMLAVAACHRRGFALSQAGQALLAHIESALRPGAPRSAEKKKRRSALRGASA